MHIARADLPRVLVREQRRAIVSCLPGEPPWWRPNGDPLARFYVSVANRLLASGWDVSDAALVLAVALVSREAGARAAREAARHVLLSRARGVTIEAI